MPGEREESPLPGAVERFLPELVVDGIPSSLDPGQTVHVVCASGRRASIAASVLLVQGLRPVVLTDAGAADLVDGPA